MTSHNLMPVIISQVKDGFRMAIFSVALLSVYLPTSSNAQKGKLPDGVVPPPISVLSKQEKKSLEAEVKAKKRTKLALTLMDSRLARSMNYTKQKKFQKSLEHLGNFYAILRNTFNYLKQNEHQKGSFKNFKRFEISLRGYIRKLEVIRRQTPFKYGYHILRLIKNVRNTRDKAIEPLFDDTVLPSPDIA